MAEEKERGDADAGTQLDKVLSHLDSIHGRLDEMDKRDAERMDAMNARMDALEKRDAEETIRYFGKGHNERKDAKEEEKEDGSTDPLSRGDSKDEDKKELERQVEGVKHEAKEIKEDSEEKEKEDRAKKDAEKEEKEMADAALADVRASIKRLERSMPRDLSDEEYQALAKEQSRADAVFHAFGQAAPLPLRGENAGSYARRIAAILKEHSPAYKDISISDLASEQLFSIARETIYADALGVASSPATAPTGELRAVKKTLESGHTMISYVGEPAAWMNEIAGSHRSYVTNLKFGGAQ